MPDAKSVVISVFLSCDYVQLQRLEVPMPGLNLDARIENLLEKMGEKDVDLLWVIQPENRRYLSGFTADDPQLTESSGSLLIGKGHRILLTDSRYSEQAKAEAPSFDIITVKGDLIARLPQILSKLGCRRLGFEAGYLIWGAYEKLKKSIENQDLETSLIPLEDVVEGLRKTKAIDEIEAIKASVKMVIDIVENIPQWLRINMTEKEAAWRIEDEARHRGAEAMAFSPIVASGPNAALPHAMPSDKKIAPGEPIVIDVGVRLDGYCSDTTRTFFLGEPDTFFQDLYRVVRQAQIEAIQTIGPDVSSDVPDKVARDIISSAGYGQYFGHALGHGVGLATHEGPRLSPIKPEPLLPGMVVTVEPGIYIPGKGGVRLEEMVLVTEDGSEVLTKDLGFYQMD